MSSDTYTPFIQHGDDITEYRLLTKEHVRVESFNGKEVLVVDQAAIEHLAYEAFRDVNFYLRKAHTQQVANILKDPKATENDKFVANAFLENAVISSKGELPYCQDTGTAIVNAYKGSHVFTEGDDKESLTKAVRQVYQDYNLRYSQIIPSTMFDEKNSGNNLPAQLDIYSETGMEYKFLFVAKGGGSGNKTFLYQQTKSLLVKEKLEAFLKEKLFSIGTAACPPYHLAIVIGGTSAEATMKTVKLASTGYLDDLPTCGDETGRAFRDLEWERTVLKIAEESGFGAQFGGKYFCHDIRVIRMPRHAASCPVGIGVSCSADRNVKGKITKDGIFLEELCKNPEAYLPESGSFALPPAPEIDLDRPMDEILKDLSRYPIRTRVTLKGTLVVARDMAHARIKEMLDRGEAMPDYFKNHPVYYAGPAKKPVGKPSGSFGPTTAQRMDPYVDEFMANGGSLVMLAKGNRGDVVTEACNKHGGFYLGSLGGPAALLAENCIKKVEVVDFEELGMEAVRKIDVVDFPAIILCDDKGNNFFAELLYR